MPKLAFRAAAVLAVASLAFSALAGAGTVAPAQAADHEVQRQQEAEAHWTVAKLAESRSLDIVETSPGKFEKVIGEPGSNGKAIQGTQHWGDANSKVRKTTGKVLFEMKYIDNGQSKMGVFNCSASAIDEPLSGKTAILTAGHCTYDQDSDEYARWWMFIPDYEANPVQYDKNDAGNRKLCSEVKYGCWASQVFNTTDTWVKGKMGDSLNEDYSIVLVGKGGKNGGNLRDELGGQKIGFGAATGVEVNAFGYPKAEPYNGKELHYANSKLGEKNASIFSMDNTMTGGCSGGPWMRNFNADRGEGELTSVNSHSSRLAPGKMFGPKLDSRAKSFYDNAIRKSVPTPANPTASKPTTSKPASSKPPVNGGLKNGEAQKFSLEAGAKKKFTAEAPKGTALTISLKGDSGDADLYVSAQGEPSYDRYDCRPWLSDSNETCTFDKGGKVYIMVDAVEAAKDLTITASWEN